MSSSDSRSRDTVQLPSGTKLEYILSHPPLDGTETESKLAVCLHPWSWLGGRMDDPCVRFSPQMICISSS